MNFEICISYLQRTACSGDTIVRPFHFQRGFCVLFKKYLNSSSGVSNCNSACLQYSLQNTQFGLNLNLKSCFNKLSLTNQDVLAIGAPQKSLKHFFLLHEYDEFHLHTESVNDSNRTVQELLVLEWMAFVESPSSNNFASNGTHVSMDRNENWLLDYHLIQLACDCSSLTIPSLWYFTVMWAVPFSWLMICSRTWTKTTFTLDLIHRLIF